MKKINISMFSLFIISIFLYAFLCVSFHLHRNFIQENPSMMQFFAIKFAVSFFFQGMSTFLLMKSVGVMDPNRLLVLLVNSMIVFICFMIIYNREMIGLVSAGIRAADVIPALFDPYMYLLHFVYSIIYFILFYRYGDKILKDKDERLFF